MRINQFISASGFCSRREADALVLGKRVKINGKIAEIGSRVNDQDRVEVDGKSIQTKKKHVYLVLNKPVGITCTTERHIQGNIIDFIHYPERIFPVGRLDKESEGLIILTSDGGIVNEILREENHHEKEYLVTVDKKLTKVFLETMMRGITIYNPVKKKHEKTKPCKIQQINATSFTIILSQGLNRQIRRMCEALDYNVVALKRTRIMHITLGALKTGKWRKLTDDEVKKFIQKSPQNKKT